MKPHLMPFKLLVASVTAHKNIHTRTHAHTQYKLSLPYSANLLNTHMYTLNTIHTFMYACMHTHTCIRMLVHLQQKG